MFKACTCSNLRRPKTISFFSCLAGVVLAVVIPASFAQGEEAAALDVNADLEGRPFFPPDNPWNADISGASVDPRSDALIASMGRDGHLHPDFGTVYRGASNGIPYVVVDGGQKTAEVRFRYADESDKDPYPIPEFPPIEGGPDGKGDRHILVLDRDNWKLFELYDAHPPRTAGAPWRAGSGAIFDLSSNALRSEGWTSSDAAGLPILPGLVRYDEAVTRKEISHALRFTCRKTARVYVAPATHFASESDAPDLPTMGMRCA